MKKLLVCLFLSLLVLCGAALAEEETFVSGDYTYVLLPDNTAEIVKYAGAAKSLDIPETLDGHVVSSVRGWAYNALENLTQVTIPANVIKMDGNPFTNCENLTSVVPVPDHPVFATIGGVLFDKTEKRLVCYPCAYTDAGYAVPQGIRGIEDYAFYASALTEVTVPDGVTSIGGSAFSDCFALEKVDIPASVTFIGDEAFSDCRVLKEVTVPDGVTSIGYKTFSTCLALEKLVLPETVTSIGEYAFFACNALEELEIPESVTTISAYGFRGSGLTKAILPSGITVIGAGTFRDNDCLTEIVIPSGVTEIGKEAFFKCTALAEVILPDSVTTIGDTAFYWSENLTNVVIPEGVTSIGDSAFRYCAGLSELTIPASVTSIGQDAFNNCPDLALCVDAGSYAETYAKENGLRYRYPENTDWLNG